jgi:transcriptional regulator with XRE-family HTH domain
MDAEQGQSRTLASLLQRYRADAIAQALGRSRSIAHAWRSGKYLPDVAALPELALFLRMDLEELTRIVAADANARKAEVA